MLKELLEQNNIRNFTEWELTKGQIIPPELIKNIIPTVKVLQEIRDQIGVPIIVNSGYRSQEKNKQVGGSKNSLHQYFNAIDFTLKNFKRMDLIYLHTELCEGKYSVSLNWNGSIVRVTPLQMGIGLYNTFIHIDARGLLGRIAPARWYENQYDRRQE